MTCNDEGCDRPADGGRGLCKKHYMRWYANRGAPCSIEGCSKPSYGRSGLCPMHYQRRRMFGQTGEAAARFMQKATIEERVRAKLDRRGPRECWPWHGRPNTSGYGTLKVAGTSRPAHVVVFELMVGSVPEGLELDHLCRNRICCNPAHLEPVTHAENVRRGEGHAAQNTRKTSCVNGHDLTDSANLKQSDLLRDGRRRCVACATAARRRRYLVSGK